eukprot:3480736-Rhodomonas_salina.2
MRGCAVQALVRLIRRGGSITELDVSHCRLERSLYVAVPSLDVPCFFLVRPFACQDACSRRLVYAIRAHLRSGNPMGDDAIELLKELKVRTCSSPLLPFVTHARTHLVGVSHSFQFDSTHSGWGIG